MTLNKTYFDELAANYNYDWAGGDDYWPKHQAILMIFRIMALFSIAGSSYIIGSTFGCNISKSERKKKIESPFYRLLVGLSCADLVSSICIFLGTWPMPRESIVAQTWWGGVGNTGTCTAQGFVFVLGWVSASLFTSFISINFVLIVRYNLSKEKLKKIQYLFFTLATILPLFVAIYFAVLKALNSLGYFCFIGVYPFYCQFADPERQDECEITRGQGNDNNHTGLIAMIITAMTYLAIFVSMSILFWTVRMQEQSSRKYNFGDHEQESYKKSKMIATKAYKYIGSFLMCNVPAVLKFFWDSWILDIIVGLTYPIQGLMNALIYTNKI